MKKFILLSWLALTAGIVFAQGKPDWVNVDSRNMKYPVNVYFTGFAYGEIPPKQTRQETINQLITDAQADLIKKIRLQITAKSQTNIEAVSKGGKYNENESFISQNTAESNADIVGIKTDSYYDAKEKLVYAFAYADRFELLGFYKSNLSMILNQIENLIKTAKNLEADREKSKARQQLEEAKPLFAKVRYAQEMLTAIDAATSVADLQQTKADALYNQLTQMQAKLSQAVLIYVNSSEDLLGKKENIVAEKVKSELALKGCSFIDKANGADFILRIKVTTRKGDEIDGIFFIWADASVELFDNHKQKEVYGDNISEKNTKGGSIEKAGRSAMENVAKKIIEKLTNWIQ